MVQYTKSADQSALAMVTIDSPRFILAVEPLAALLEFAVAPFKQTGEAQAADDEQDNDQPGNMDVQEVKQTQSALSYRVDIVHSTVIVLADDTDPRTQAIHLSIKEILVSQNNVLALKVDKLGMSFGRMDKPNENLSFLDDVSIAMTMDNHRRGSHQMSLIDIDIPVAVIFRASFNDITLILDIVNKATTAAAKVFATESAEDEAHKPAAIIDSSTSDRRTSTTGQSNLLVPTKSNRRASVSRRRLSSASHRRASSLTKTRVLVSKEKLQLRVNGFQFVLVGDMQEMPMVHLATKEFTCIVNDWSNEVSLIIICKLTLAAEDGNIAHNIYPVLQLDKLVLRAPHGSMEV